MKTRTLKDMSEAVGPERVSLKAEVSELQGLLNEQKRAWGDVEKVIGSVKEHVRAFKPLAPVYAKRVKASGGKPVALVVQITDWHIGLVTPKEATEGFGECNLASAKRRVAQLAESITKYRGVMAHGYDIDECVVLATGDYVSGDIHEGLVRTNEFPTPVQAVEAGFLVAWFVQQMAAVFPKVRVEFMAPGNHDRLTKKPQAQAGGWNSWGFVVGKLAEKSLEAQRNVSFSLHPTMQEIVDVKGRRYLVGHGDGILGTWGIPFYGIERKKQREAMARMNMAESKHFDKIVIGHFHTGLDHEHWMVGGSLSGTDENDHKEGRHSRPHQTTWMVHPGHGEFGFTRWYLD